ncbi:deoxyribodipyrimidine photolyase-related protein [Catalinimonas alkaloidigena]|uniref:cryptochrome/photolyase family protein n=1 Tax=Catalinimonas alkaloidigena TaxID=1075417 RepID=UPI002405006B|nr:cryptochrome/photolyase family protein [Catalinimonas alkaloidigena]MDF9797460.1 deoxyribodipyrimidine photolyase-related protein [Catalinimonas alkaloidigena]
MAYKKIALILGNCLFPDHGVLNLDKQTLFYMAEDTGLCTHFKYHKHKLVFFLSAMRSHAEQIEKEHPLQYWKLTESNIKLSYEDKLDKTLSQYASIEEIVSYQIEDHFFEERIKKFCQQRALKFTQHASPGFINTIQDFQNYLDDTKKPFMQTFYKAQRKKLNILMDDESHPVGRSWSYDQENRKKLPKDIRIPPPIESDHTSHTQSVIEVVDQLFHDHPGNTENFHWATTRRQALYRLNDFLENRFQHFGPYEDAIDRQRNFLFHSVLSPYLNVGLITPDEVMDKTLAYAEKHNVHLPSVEGFVRQIIGWREFMRGMYHTHNLQGNFFNHKRKLKACWYEGATQVPPLDDSIKRVVRDAYTHHIERLMVLGNIMLLSEIHPDEVYKWFMEMFIDSSDWVMVPNVYGMSQFADGGTFATKPYIGGANYISKMSDYTKKGKWSDEVDGLYWRFIDRNRKLFGSNPRMSMMVSMYDKMKGEKKDRLLKAADEFIQRTTSH